MRSLVRCSHVCRALHALSKHEILWRWLLERDFKERLARLPPAVSAAFCLAPTVEPPFARAAADSCRQAYIAWHGFARGHKLTFSQCATPADAEILADTISAWHAILRTQATLIEDSNQMLPPASAEHLARLSAQLQQPVAEFPWQLRAFWACHNGEQMQSVEFGQLGNLFIY